MTLNDLIAAAARNGESVLAFPKQAGASAAGPSLSLKAPARRRTAHTAHSRWLRVGERLKGYR